MRRSTRNLAVHDPAARPRAVLALTVTFALAIGACLPPTVGPTPSPSPATPAPSAWATPAPSPSPSGPTPSPTPAFIVHTVVASDSLLSIGERYDTSGRSVAYWNRTTYPSLDPESPDYAPDRIQIGWELVVYPGTEYDPESEATPVPSPAPHASLVIPPGATPGASGAAVIVSSGGRGGNAVALTFDMGGRVEPTADIVRWLVDHDVPTTIFLTGAALTGTDAGREVAALITAHPDLFTVGNHTWDHPDVTTLDAGAIRDQLTRTDDAVLAALGVRSTPLFRPPYGAHDTDARAAIAAAGWPYIVMWDVDALDWRPGAEGGPTADDIRTKVLSRAEGGSIVLMHLGGWNTLDALPAIVNGLRANGLEPVTLHRMLGLQAGG
ncbi:MAG: hypothetical protein DWI58_13125 [Chloroflexi bacterium]|nr:MAG: hypothetical protein DWI58_13125 [Chloroflexota bacterium]